MEHIEGQTHSQQVSRKKSVGNFNYEKRVPLLSDAELESTARDLNLLGTHFDPFNPGNFQEFQKLIKDLGLEYFLNDPFQFTNIILKRLDQIETELKKRKH